VDFETKLVVRMTKLAETHPRWGYRDGARRKCSVMLTESAHLVAWSA
jgi:hypothetical protein